MTKPQRFAFIIHPLDISDVARKYKVAARIPRAFLRPILALKKPSIISEITGIETKTGLCAEGVLIGLPLLPEQLKVQGDRLSWVYDKITQCCVLAHNYGARLIGLGAFTAVAGDAGISIVSMLRKRNCPIAVVTGNLLTVSTAIEAVFKAAAAMDINLTSARLAIVGATGSIGQACAHIIAQRVPSVPLQLVGLNMEKLVTIADRLVDEKENVVVELYQTDDWLRHSKQREVDIILVVSSALETIFAASSCKPGTVVCDVSRPRNVVADADDVLVIDGGLVKFPGDVDFGFNFGLPKGIAYACMAETMLRACICDFSDCVGRDYPVSKIERIALCAENEGFVLADDFRGLNGPITQEMIEAIKTRVWKTRPWR